MDKEGNTPEEETGTATPLPSHSEEWQKLHSTVASLREDLLLRLQDAQRIMEGWESSLKLREEEYREAREQCEQLATARNERWEREKREMEENLQARLKSVLTEKDARITGLEKERDDKDTRISELIGQLSDARRDIDKVNGLSDMVAERFDIHTADPSMIVRLVKDRIAKYESELETLRNDLVNRPGEEDYEQLKNEKARLENENTQLSNMNRKFAGTIGTLQAQAGEVALLKQRNEALEQESKAKQLDFDNLKKELERLQSIYQNASERDARVRSIEAPCIEFHDTTAPKPNEETDELAWLTSIAKGCRNYGLKFLNRILLSFHTSLKTAEWSPITVLAGVSGTGKSELPRLYSHFGGINFLSLSVQSNWDSQEAMLGYFNTIENFFDAQPVLRLLAQSQKKWEDGFGLKDYMTMVLMDEMNLAHVELYFAEFLSKLEQRRGCSEAQVPLLDVKLGANIEPYKLPLGRNVLWTGTMNQDETTKSLSDKVLDRSIVINFPRPVKLESRTKLSELPANNGLLPRETWQSWLEQSREIPKDILSDYKKRVEEINSYLSNAGRAIGHRVWQSIQNYMMNYPLVVAAADKTSDEYGKYLDIAFEDQLVQKVMPKLRGIETTGTPMNSCLDPIRHILEDNHPSLAEDFDLALKSGYGQFIWNSALYLTNGEDDAKLLPLDDAKPLPLHDE